MPFYVSLYIGAEWQYPQVIFPCVVQYILCQLGSDAFTFQCFRHFGMIIGNNIVGKQAVSDKRCLSVYGSFKLMIFRIVDDMQVHGIRFKMLLLIVELYFNMGAVAVRFVFGGSAAAEGCYLMFFGFVAGRIFHHNIAIYQQGAVG